MALVSFSEICNVLLPFVPCVGYVWNGMMHQKRAPALAGAMAVGTIASILHILMPRFEMDKALTAAGLDLDLLSDPDGSRGQFAMKPPVLEPFSMQQSREFMFYLALKVLPVKEVSDEEYEKMQRENPPMTISLRRCELRLSCV
jgi:hypothetical protein